MKKLLAIVLSLAMLLSMSMLAGCGDKTPASSGAPSGAGSSAADASGSGDESADGPVYETRKLIATTDKAENDDGGLIIGYFCDYITEKSGGAITFNVSYGGTLCTGAEELGMLTSGAVDLACIGTTLAVDNLPLVNFPTMVLGDSQTAVDYYNYLCFENEETAELIAAEAAAQNVIYLGFQAGGTTCWLSTKELTCIDDIKGIKFGAMQNQGAFESLGVSVVSFNMPDGYENLSKGVIDAVTMAFNPTVAMRWYEVAPNYLMLGTYVAGSPFTLNLDTWNSLNADEQALFREAAQAAGAYSMELATAGYDKNMALLEENGVVVNTISDEEGALWYDALFSYQVTNCRNVAENQGISEDMETILAAAADFVDVELP